MNQADGAGVEIASVQCNTEANLFLFLRASEALQERLERELRTIDLSAAKFHVLTHVAHATEPLPIRELARAKECVPSNMTTLVDRLEADGLVIRVDDPHDRRLRRVQLTASGASRIREAMSLIETLNQDFDERVANRGQFTIREIIVAVQSF